MKIEKHPYVEKDDMYQESGITFFKSTPSFLKIAEKAHLNSEFNHKNTDGQSIKLLPPQITDTVITNNLADVKQRDQFNFTNNGVYSYSKCLATNVVQIDVHSLLPTWAFNSNLLDKHHRKLFLRKKEIEATPNYHNNYRLVNERKRIKNELNIYCSQNGKTKKEQYVNRLKCMYSGMNMINDMIQFWGKRNVINCVNDGLIVLVRDKSRFESKYKQFKVRYQSRVKKLTFSIKFWKYALIKNDQEYLLMNTTDDYKCRNHCFDINANYFARTGSSLRELQKSNGIIDSAALQAAENEEKGAVEILYKQLFDADPHNEATKRNLDRLSKVNQIMKQAGYTDINHGVNPISYYKFEIDDANNEQAKQYVNAITNQLLGNQLFVTSEKITDRINLLNQPIKVTKIEEPEKYLKDHPKTTVNNFVPPIIDPLSSSIDDWIKLEILRNSDVKHNLYLYNTLAVTLQVWANENKRDPNSIIKKLNKNLSDKQLKMMDIADKVYNDPATLLVDNQLMALNEHHIYTSEPAVVNNIIDKYVDSGSKRFIKNARNNVAELLTNTKYQNNQLDIGFKSDNQTIWLDKNGVHVTSPLKKKMENYVNVDYVNYEGDMKLFNSKEYNEVSAFLAHLSNGHYRQLTCMLALLVLQNTNIMPKIRRFFILFGEPGSGKTVLVKLLEKIFDEPKKPSCILSGESNVNKAFTDPNLVDVNDTKKGKLALWFDDAQSDSQSNAIKASTGTVINSVISNEAKTGAAKFQQYHRVKLPSLVVIATNSIPQIKQAGTADRMFVISSTSRLLDDPNFKIDTDINTWIDNKKVQKVLFSIILNTAVDMLNMSDRDLKLIFDKKNSSQSELTNLNSSIEAFFENKNIASPYDLVGMQAIKLFNAYSESEKTKSYKTTYRVFCEQLEMLGLVLKRKHFHGKNYQKVICAKNEQLTNEKMKVMLEDYKLTPDQVEYWDRDVQQQRGEIKSWHYGYDDLKNKYVNDTATFTPFRF
ncbi:hypothetical protein H5S40_04295 [Limosilactobacillus sp. RRLNB_1_1]|uniref:SF3 helicase domain-containing protein n=1 Tax=Limosilactobacillus albertensis TaxID=2759752 RepID=A0A7W3TRR0_9LACO|nr:hypothetical protein [Limosilactobacillus albertensis]MBB1069376.1 hypothetical protein [Limosilactobacillus albertensis]MCD7118592.1 hypothetical protein [Limosilactobacillus albertensis]MCD7128363.1 hypothetical protein [Limosilactobacillus albertensis]